jgi:hypothetical protein
MQNFVRFYMRENGSTSQPLFQSHQFPVPASDMHKDEESNSSGNAGQSSGMAPHMEVICRAHIPVIIDN